MSYKKSYIYLCQGIYNYICVVCKVIGLKECSCAFMSGLHFCDLNQWIENREYKIENKE